MTTREFVFSLIALWIRSLTLMYSCSCFTPEMKQKYCRVNQMQGKTKILISPNLAFGANLVKDALSIHLDLGSKKQQKNVGTQERIRGKIDYFIFRVVYSICKNSIATSSEPHTTASNGLNSLNGLALEPLLTNERK